MESQVREPNPCRRSLPEIKIVETNRANYFKKIKTHRCVHCGNLLRRSVKLVQVFRHPEHEAVTGVVTEK